MNTILSEIQKDMDDFFVEMDNEVYDHSIDIIDPDEPELPGPPYDSYGYNDEDVSYLDSLQTTVVPSTFVLYLRSLLTTFYVRIN